MLERDQKLDELQQKNNLVEKDRAALKSQLSEGGLGGGSILGGEPGSAGELERIREQNEKLKAEVEALNHVQAKLVAKNKRYRDMHKGELED